MSRKPEALRPHLESLLANERAFSPAPEAMRRRAFSRARAAISEGGGAAKSPWWASRSLFKGRWLVAVAVGIATAAAWAAVRDRRGDPESVRDQLDSLPTSPWMTPSRRAAEGPDVWLLPMDLPRPAVPREANSSRRDSPGIPPAPSLRRGARSEGYDAELLVLGPARSAVAHGAFTTALAAIAEHKRRFPAGKLTEEREALRIQALLGLGHDDKARDAAAAFHKAFPTSVLLPPLEEMVTPAP